MKPEELLCILSRAAKLKTTTRHCYSADDRKESVADHSFRIALMAMLLQGEEEFRSMDMDKVIRMCLIHDLGEAFTGDIPTFEKTSADTEKETALFLDWVGSFPSPQKEEWLSLLEEMESLSTWLPLEYDLQLTYGKENVEFSEYLKV